MCKTVGRRRLSARAAAQAGAGRRRRRQGNGPGPTKPQPRDSLSRSAANLNIFASLGVSAFGILIQVRIYFGHAKFYLNLKLL